MPEVFIGIGANLGDRAENITEAINNLRDTPGISIEKASKPIETKPVSGPPQPDYLNAVIKITTDLPAQKLLAILQDIEKKLGRKRSIKNAPRPIDLDILLYGNQIIDEPDLKVPHPNMLEREFVMKPLLELEPDILKKVTKVTKVT